MTTSNSPEADIRAQANKIAALLKEAWAGEGPINRANPTRLKESITFAIAMDNKILNIEMTWMTIHLTTEAGIAEYIFEKMRDGEGAVQ